MIRKLSFTVREFTEDKGRTEEGQKGAEEKMLMLEKDNGVDLMYFKSF